MISMIQNHQQQLNYVLQKKEKGHKKDFLERKWWPLVLQSKLEVWYNNIHQLKDSPAADTLPVQVPVLGAERKDSWTAKKINQTGRDLLLSIRNQFKSEQFT